MDDLICACGHWWELHASGACTTCGCVRQPPTDENDAKAEAHLAELYQSIEHSIELLRDYGAGRLRYLRIRDVTEIIMLLRNYRREKFGNPITDRERKE